jgi:hypothetical protein
MVDMKKKATDILEDYSNSYSQVDLETLTKFLEQIISEAIKEFMAKAKFFGYYIDYPKEHRVIDEEDLDNLVKEMTEGE